MTALATLFGLFNTQTDATELECQRLTKLAELRALLTEIAAAAQ